MLRLNIVSVWTLVDYGYYMKVYSHILTHINEWMNEWMKLKANVMNESLFKGYSQLYSKEWMWDLRFILQPWVEAECLVIISIFLWDFQWINGGLGWMITCEFWRSI